MLEQVPVVRPLLGTSRADVEYSLVSQNQPRREDHTNSDTKLTRNRIRHELLPLLERDYNPNIRRVLGETAEIALAEDDFWRNHVANLVSRWHQKVHRMRLQGHDGITNGFLSAEVALQRHALRQFLEWHGITADFQHVEATRRCVLGEISSANLPGGWRATVDGNWLSLITPASGEDDSSSAEAYAYLLPIPGRTTVSEAGITVVATHVKEEAAAAEPPGTLLRASTFGRDATIRNWQPGDRFRPAHSGSEKKLKELFADKRIPPEQRRLWPVVLSGVQIVWVRGLPVARDFAWVPGSGDALRIEVIPNT
jgi:tRNA(Ile)-lysidine synthase